MELAVCEVHVYSVSDNHKYIAFFFMQTVPKLVDASSLENKNARAVSCGARHSAIITGTFDCTSIFPLEGICYPICLI
jgi:uncharacterized protein CbrC (UPF0167 family)